MTVTKRFVDFRVQTGIDRLNSGWTRHRSVYVRVLTFIVALTLVTWTFDATILKLWLASMSTKANLCVRAGGFENERLKVTVTVSPHWPFVQSSWWKVATPVWPANISFNISNYLPSLLQWALVLINKLHFIIQTRITEFLTLSHVITPERSPEVYLVYDSLFGNRNRDNLRTVHLKSES